MALVVVVAAAVMAYPDIQRTVRLNIFEEKKVGGVLVFYFLSTVLLQRLELSWVCDAATLMAHRPTVCDQRAFPG